MATIFSMRLAIGTQLGKIRFVLLPGNVASMGLLEEKRPFLLGNCLRPLFAI